MRRPVWFVDTSVVLNLLAVPGFSQDRGRLAADLAEKQRSGDSLILPVASVVETGNHIAQLKNGTGRRRAAQKFCIMLRLVADGRAPWQVHSADWDSEFIRRFVEGGASGSDLVDHAMRGVGCGDLSILLERDVYRERTGLSDVWIWTLDAGLAAHA